MDEMMKTKGANVVIVGIKLLNYNAEGDDDEKTSGRELLTSTLSGLTETGDSVIALHVQPHHSTSDIISRRWRRSESGKIKTDSFRNDNIYESICNIEKVDIQVKVVEDGSSLKKIVVEEAKKTKASKVILGYAYGKAHSSPLQHMSPVYLAKYCSKRLPYSCSVIVIEEGKVAFQKEGAMKRQYDDDDDDASRVLNTIRRTIRNHTKIARNTIIPHVDHIMKRKSCSPPQLQLDDHRKHSRVSVPLMQFLDKSALAHIMCTSQGHVIGSKKMAEKAHRRVHCLPECIKSDDSRIKLCHASSLDRFSQAKSCHVIGDPLQAGWPLLRRCTTMNENRQMSVIEWALHLPDRPKENLNGQYCPWRVNECTTITKSNTMEVVKYTDSNTSMHTICNANTIPPRLELLIREKKSCHREFHLLELQAATSNFSTSNIIGKGGCSEVYRGTLLNGELVAVKCINASSTDSEGEFVTEVEIVGTLRHRHIIQLFGYCIGFDHYYLVYNFASEGNLEHKLHGYGDLKIILPWEVRYKVAVGIAEALTYLHEGCTRPIIHRDVKSSNILLDSSFAPVLADFGLAKWAPTLSSHITCGDVVGTFGYLAPEYFMFGKVSEKTDVFSFGVVLLELVTGRKPINNECAKGEENLVVWARPLLDDGPNFGLLVDPKLEGNYNEGQLKSMIITGALCLRQSPQRRPRMIRIRDILLNGEVGDLEYATSICHDISCKELVDDIGYDMRSIYSSEYSDSIQKHLTLALLDLDDDNDESSHDEGSIDDNVILSHSSIKDLEEYSR